jgi:hypothetical protein
VCPVECYRRNPRHTSPLQDLPAQVQVTRAHHALTGKALKVFGKINRKGQLHLVLVLPDGTRSYIPAAWTDFKSPGLCSPKDEPCLAACLSDLLRTRQRVDALLRRIGTTPINTTGSTQENRHASKSTGTVVRGTASDSAPLSTTQPRATDSPNPAFGVPAAKTGPQSNRDKSSTNSKQHS